MKRLKDKINLCAFLILLACNVDSQEIDLGTKHFDIDAVSCDFLPPVLWPIELWKAAYSNLPAPGPQAFYGLRDYGYPRTLRGHVGFYTDGWKYNLTDQATNPNNFCMEDWKYYQAFWNKIMAIKVTRFDGTENSIRLGFRYIPGGPEYFPDKDGGAPFEFPVEAYGKFELGFYGHLNHLQLPYAYPEEVGREFVGFGVYVSPFENEYFELKLDEKDFFARAGDVGVLVHRDIFNGGSPLYSASHINIEAYYGTGQEEKDYWRATDDLDFYGFDLVGDDPDDEITETTTPVLKIMNSVFYPGESKTYWTRDSLVAPVKSIGGVESIANNTSYESEGQFAVIESGASIYFSSMNEIILNPGFSALPGSNWAASITNTCNGCRTKVKIQDTPKLSKSRSEELIANISDKLNNGANADVIRFNNQNAVSRSPKDLNASSITLAPNPAHNFLYLRCVGGCKGQIIIVNMYGQPVRTAESYGEESVFDVGSLPAGNYTVLLNTDDGNTFTKLFSKVN